ncbi:MAG TPA: beta-lactamase family protein [Candidatus Agrococcus pullicola]|uniref:Beta-lactamase family protein n=1 Tax=Candidatus Agrococcus pullicola TaxID=2838429 RepID=A0A9D2CA80_9MICO|nr:beta-lactamase family protein [Candidatus Agrococcus pullicola]
MNISRPRNGVRAVATLALTIALILTSPALAAATPEHEDLRDRIEALIGQHLGETTPGAMVAVVDAEGSVVTETRGWSDPVAEVPLTPETRTPVASVSKVVTALTALQLHHAGILDLDSDIRDSLPLDDRRGSAADGPVTGRHLLTHHSGLAEPLLLHPAPDADDGGTLLSALTDNPPRLEYPSGAGLHYSPLQGYALLGAAIEEATNGTFDAAVREWVFDPVGAESADFTAPSPQDGDVQMSTLGDDGWSHTDWIEVAERPAAALTWSTQDAAALLHSMVSGEGLAQEVIAEATAPAIRPAHGGGGHTQVFFESHRADLPVLEHAGAGGLAWLALIPEAEIGVFAAVTTEDPAAAEFTDAVLDEVAQWAVDTGRAIQTPQPAEGMPAIVPEWAADVDPVVPVGTFQEQLFAGRGPEALLRSVTGQFTVRADGDDLVIGDRLLRATATPGRWCDERGCLAGVRTDDGAVLLLRSDGGMLQQTLREAPWWADMRFVIASVIGTLLLAGFAIGGAMRAWSNRRNDRTAPTAVARRVALAWSAVSLALIGSTLAFIAAPMTADAAAHLDGNGLVVWLLRTGTAVQLALGALWFVMMILRWPKLRPLRRALVVPTAVIGIAMSIVLASWALPGT